jgi:hypothetical protein
MMNFFFKKKLNKKNKIKLLDGEIKKKSIKKIESTHQTCNLCHANKIIQYKTN